MKLQITYELFNQVELHYNLSKDVIFLPCNTGNVFIVPKDYHISHEKKHLDSSENEYLEIVTFF